MNSPIPEEPQQASQTMSRQQADAESPSRERRQLAIDNPCKPGSRKALVYDSALKHESVASVKQRLDRIKRGAATRLSEYIGDLRSENALDIQIRDGRLVCLGKLSGSVR